MTLRYHSYFPKLVWYHFYPGLAILVFYITVSPYIVKSGLPGLAALLIAEILILAPIGIIHMLSEGKRLNKKVSLKNVVVFKEKLTAFQYWKWSIIGILGCVLVYVPLYPLGLILRENVFSWLPPWYFDPGYGTTDMSLVANVFLAGILIDGFVGPVIEELYFRGYLLPRMTNLKHWAPIVNGILFGLYHFWQPHNYVAITAIGVILSYIVWKKRNVYLGIIIHCFLNIMGAVSGYLAADAGHLISR